MCHTVLGCPLSSLTLHMTARKIRVCNAVTGFYGGHTGGALPGRMLALPKAVEIASASITDENSVLLAPLHCRIQIIDPQALRIYCRILSAKTIFVLWRIRSRALALWSLSGRSDDPCSHGPASLSLDRSSDAKVYRGLEAGRRADLRTA